jgi:ribA/ribD-fused uncharacterized protein
MTRIQLTFTEQKITKPKEEKFTFFWLKDSVLSNWHPAPFELGGIKYNCTEQHMMYNKAMFFNDTHMAERIMKSDSPDEQKKLGRRVKGFDVDEWDKVCKEITYNGCRAKFLQNPEMLKFLLQTKGTTLVEASPFDTIWGIGLDAKDPKAKDRSQWRGKNYLGEILTKLREDLISEGVK